MSDLQWIRRASFKEIYMYDCGKKGTNLSSFMLNLSTKNILQSDLIIRAMEHLFRKISLLRLCLREKGPQKHLWICNMPSQKLDFQVVEHTDREKVERELKIYQHNTFDGPLWCVRFQKVPKEPSEEGMEVNIKYPHRYRLFLGIHHSITDGTTSNSLLGFFAQVLDDLISGNDVDDSPMAVYADPPNYADFVKEDLKDDEGLKARMFEELKKEDLMNCSDMMYFKRSFPSDEPFVQTTERTGVVFSVETTSALRAKCKSMGVTVHSAISAAANLAFVELIQEGELKLDSYKVATVHDINARRYWSKATIPNNSGENIPNWAKTLTEGSPSKALGCHISRLYIRLDTPSNINDVCFWDYASHFHDKLYELLNKQIPLWMLIYDEEKEKKKIDDDNQIECSKQGASKAEIGISNLGDITSLVPSDLNNIDINDIICMASLNGSTKIFCQIVSTFRGRLSYNIDYLSSFMSERLARRFVELAQKQVEEAVREI